MRAGESVFSISARSTKLSTCSVRGARPSAARFHAASKRSRQSPAGPTRISSSFGGAFDIFLEIVAQLLDRAEFVRQRAPPDAAMAVGVFDQVAVSQDIGE